MHEDLIKELSEKISRIKNDEVMEVDLKDIGFEVVCRNLTTALAQDHKRNNPDFTIVEDSLNLGMFVVMKFNPAVNTKVETVESVEAKEVFDEWYDD